MLTVADVIEALTGFRPVQATPVVTDAVSAPKQVIPGALYVQLELTTEAASPVELVSQALENGSMLVLTEHAMPSNIRTIRLEKALNVETISAKDLPLCLQVEDVEKALHQIALFWRAKLPTKVVAVTGSIGKTTTKDLIAEVLHQRYRTFTNKGKTASLQEIPLAWLTVTEQYERGVLEVDLDAVQNSSFLATMVSPSIVVLTTVGYAHAQQYGSPEDVVERVTELLAALPKDGIAIVNYDDPAVRTLGESLAPSNRITYGLDPNADIWADHVDGMGLEGIRFDLHHRGETIHLSAPILGRHSVHTVLRAAAVGLAEGLSLDEIVKGLHFRNTQLRLVVGRSETGALLLDDTYNASPESVLAALNLLDELGGRKIAVLGSMTDLGDYTRQAHELVGLRAAQVVDHFVAVGEYADLYASAARQAWLSASSITVVNTPEDAAEFLRPHLTKKDVVLVKGPRELGMEMVVHHLERPE